MVVHTRTHDIAHLSHVFFLPQAYWKARFEEMSNVRSILSCVNTPHMYLLFLVLLSESINPIRHF